MQYAQVVACVAQHVGLEDVYVLHALILHEVGEALALHAGHVEDVGVGDGVFVEVGMLHVADAVLLAVYLVLGGHGQLLGCDEVELGVEVAHGHEQRVHRASILEVSHEVYVEVFQRALCLVYGVQVEHRLRGVLVGTVAGVDDGYRRYFAGVACSALEVVAHHDEVGIVAHHHDGVFEALALR